MSRDVGVSFWNTAKGYVKYYLTVDEASMLGSSEAKIRIKSLSPIDISPERFVYVEIDIKPCYVYNFSFMDEDQAPFSSLVLNLGETISVPFVNFTQTPDCQYEVIYEVKLMQKQAYQSQEIPTYQRDAEEPSPSFVTLDLLTSTIEVKPEDSSLSGKTFTVFVNGIVQTEPTVQAIGSVVYHHALFDVSVPPVFVNL